MKYPFEDEFLGLVRKQLECVTNLASAVDAKVQRLQNLIVGVALVTWVLQLIIFITVLLV